MIVAGLKLLACDCVVIQPEISEWSQAVAGCLGNAIRIGVTQSRDKGCSVVRGGNERGALGKSILPRAGPGRRQAVVSHSPTRSEDQLAIQEIGIPGEPKPGHYVSVVPVPYPAWEPIRACKQVAPGHFEL